MNEIAEVKAREECLRVAMLAGDTSALSGLIDDRLVFTAPDGSVLTKKQDISAHASGLLRFNKIDFTDASFHPIGDMVLSTTKAALTGSFGGAEIGGTFAYTRLWSRSSGEWRVIAGHASAMS